MDDLTKKRWEKVTDPNKHDPRTALEAALADHDQDPYHHVIVVFCRLRPDETMDSGFKQAGQLDKHFGGTGLLEHVKSLL